MLDATGSYGLVPFYLTMRIRVSSTGRTARWRRPLQGAAAASGLLFSAAARKQLPLPVPYDLTDLRTVFGAAIKARGGELSETFPSSGPGSSSSSSSSGSVKTIRNNLALNTFARRTSSASNRLLVECFAAPFQCAPCNAFSPVYGKAAAESAVNAPSGILECV